MPEADDSRRTPDIGLARLGCLAGGGETEVPSALRLTPLFSDKNVCSSPNIS